MTRQELIRVIRRVKLRLMAGGAARRMLVPFVEVAEFWLSHGFREVIIRSQMRLRGGMTPQPSTYALREDSEEPLLGLTLPPSGDQLVTSIVIPVLDNAALTHRCLVSIIKETREGTYEVIVVDNGSDEPTRKMLSSVTGLRLVRNDTNVGFVGACNQGAAAARGEFVLFLNNDTIVLPGWLDALLRTFDRDPLVGAVGAMLVYPDGSLQEAGGIIWSDGHGWNYGRNEDPNLGAFGYVRDVDYCSGACLAVRRSVFERLNGFDTRYAPAYYEDVDLAFRLRENGYRVLYQPAAKIVHFEGSTGGTDTSSGFKAYQVLNHQTFVERHAVALAAQYPHDPDLLSSARDRRRGKRLLVMDHMVPHHDQDAGSLRMQALLRMLVELGFRVTFLPDNLAGLEPYTSELQQLGIEVLYGRTEIGFLERHGAEFDVAILCRAHFAAKYLPELRASTPRPFIIFDTVDLHYLREQRLAELEDSAGLARAAERTRQIEMGVMRSSDMVWVTSTHEAELLRDTDVGSKVEIVPLIHDIRADVPPFGSRRNILFIGSFRHPPNEDAVIYFVEEILPLVKSELPGVQFLVVGAHAPRSIRKLASPDVSILGFVQDVRPVFDACRVSVAPIRYGAGVKGKVTQSLAWGLPAVATPVAAEGTQMVEGQHLLIASDPASFARRVIEVYEDEDLWTRLSTAGRRQVEACLGYESIRASVGAMLQRASREARASTHFGTSAPPLPKRTFAGPSQVVKFRCNVCGAPNKRPMAELTREGASCDRCGSTVRARAVVHHVSQALFGKSLALPDFPKRPDVRGVGMSDWAGYAQPLAERLNYTNTFYHQEPFLDITAVPDDMAGTCDFMISTEVFEHVCPPVSRAFEGARRLLKPGGTLVLTVPYMLEDETREHYPDLHKFEIVSKGEGAWLLINTRKDGEVEQFDNLVFHGGPGTTLEMRLFAKTALQHELQRAGFTRVHFADEAVPEFGIHWLHPWSLPIVARVD